MKPSEKLKAERAFIDEHLGGKVICNRCSATLGTFADACSADLDDPCPGFLAIGDTRAEFNRTWKKHHEHLREAWRAQAIRILRKHLKIGGHDAWEGHYYFVDGIEDAVEALVIPHEEPPVQET